MAAKLPSDFDPKVYLKMNPDVAEARIDAARHYLEHGNREGRLYKQPTVPDGDIEKLRESLLFDAEFYLSRHPDVQASGISPEAHFLAHGAKEGRWASLYFRTDWYAQRYEIPCDVNPLFHYLDVGSAKYFEPNPFFEPSYYCARYLDKMGGMEPLKHFIMHGHEGYSPSPRFDAQRYNSDYGLKGVNPLHHYLTEGMAAGCIPLRASPPTISEQLQSAWLIRKHSNGDIGKRNALLVTFAKNGKLKPHVTHLIRGIRQSGYSVHLVITADSRFVPYPPELLGDCSSIFLRENKGYDFGAWAHVLTEMPQFWDGDELLLANDSVFGPLNFERLTKLAQRIQQSHSDIIGLTSNYEYAEHFQSYFLVLKKRALASPAMRDFFRSIVNFSDKSQVIREYEIPFLSRMKAAGLQAEVCFPAYQKEQNPVILDWDRLIDDGFPFVKASILNGPDQSLVDQEKVAEKMRETGFPPRLIPTTTPSSERPPFRWLKSRGFPLAFTR